MTKGNKGAAIVAILSAAWLYPATASAFDFGVGNGCSAIGGVEATSLTNGDTFMGRIGATGVSGFNKNGKPADDTDSDGLTDSIEECINDSLIGHCSTINGDDAAAIMLTPGDTSGKKNNKQMFTVTFLDVSGCAITQCSDQEDNDGDGLTDYPDDPDCTDYDDNDEADGSS